MPRRLARIGGLPGRGCARSERMSDEPSGRPNDPLTVQESAPSQPIVVAEAAAPVAEASQSVVVDASTLSASTPAQVSFTASIASSFSMPLPPPEIVKQYSKFIPNVGERLLAMVEEETRHRRKLEMQEVEATIEDRRAQRTENARGQYCALAIGLGALIAGAVTSILDHPIAGSLFGTGGVGGLVVAFLWRRPSATGTEQSAARKPIAEASPDQK
jgi:uncharacterized membrane protein